MFLDETDLITIIIVSYQIIIQRAKQFGHDFILLVLASYYLARV